MNAVLIGAIDRMGILNEGKDDEDCHIRGRLALISR